MKKKLPDVTYDLIPSQQTIYLMVKYSLHKQVTQIPTSISLNREIDFDLMKKALNIEISRNDCLRARFIKVNKKLQQYFIPEYTVEDVPVKLFSSAQEQNDYFSEDAQKPVYFLKDEIFRIVFFRSYDGNSGIYLNVSHLNMDAMGVVIFYMDMLAVYRALKTGTELPPALSSYEEYIKKELVKISDTEKMCKHEAFYREYFLKGGEPFYAGVHGHDLLDKARKKNPACRVPAAYSPLNDKADVIERVIAPDDAKKIFEYCSANSVAPESILQLGIRTHCSSINYRTDDVFMMSMCSKRVTVKDKHMSGCVTQPLQMRTILSESDTFEEALKQYFDTRAQLFRHMDYPYITARDLSREIYNYNMIQGPACMMFSWIPVPYLPDSDIKFQFNGYNLGRYITPCYTICYPDPNSGTIKCRYMYRTHMITPEQINAMHDNAVSVITAGIEDPQITIGKLLDKISN